MVFGSGAGFPEVLSTDDIDGTNGFTVEAWVTPANTTQDGPARIFTYSRGNGTRNFMLGQVAYQYVARTRTYSTETNNNGSPDLETYDVDQDAQATLQHVVMTYDQVNGRRIYVDGRWTDGSGAPGHTRSWRR